MSATTVVSLENAGFTYNAGKRNAKAVFSGINLDIGAGQMAGIVGPSGSGKTTLLSVLAQLESPTEGEVSFFGVDTTGWGTSKLRREFVGLVTQTGDLDPSLTAIENVRLIPNLLGKRVSRSHARELLEAVGLTEAMGQRPKALSAGERQRVAIARALACQPAIIFADEPTANLDSASKAAVLDTIAMVKPRECAVVIVSHDVEVVQQHCTRVIHMQDGQISE